jgi:hypothetical protein
MASKNRFKIIATFALCVTTFACEGGVEELDTGLDGERDEIVANLIEAGYPESEIELDDEGQVIVGGDAVVSLEASREMAGFDPDGFRAYRSTNVVSASVDTICVYDGAVFSANMNTALNKAIENFNSQGLHFTLYRNSYGGCDAVIYVNLVHGERSHSGFPANGMPYGTINIEDTVASFAVPLLTHFITHEFGHAFGLRHADYYDRSISCFLTLPENEGQTSTGAHHIPNTPTTATPDGSIMNSCVHSWATGVWTSIDVTALQELYGGSFCDLYSGDTIALRSYHGRYMRAGGSDEGWRMNQASSISGWERFRVTCDSAQIALQTAHGRYVQAGDFWSGYGVKQQTFIGEWEWFTPVRQANGTWAFSTLHDRYLRADDSTWNIDQQTYVGGWETFTVVPQ